MVVLAILLLFTLLLIVTLLLSKPSLDTTENNTIGTLFLFSKILLFIWELFIQNSLNTFVVTSLHINLLLVIELSDNL